MKNPQKEKKIPGIGDKSPELATLGWKNKSQLRWRMNADKGLLLQVK